MLVKLIVNEQELQKSIAYAKDHNISEEFINDFYIPQPITDFVGFYSNLNIDTIIENLCGEKILKAYNSFSSHENYGICDSVDQILNNYPELIYTDRRFVVTFTPIIKKEEPSRGGWRWHKWGEYIGTQHPACEYIYDEPVIEQVYVYHIYELK